MWDKDETAPQTESKADTRSNLEILKCFCGAKKNQEGVDKDDLVRFYNWYKERCNEWDGPFKVESLYNTWVSKRKTKVA